MSDPSANDSHAWDAATYGNHRAVVRVQAAAPAVRAHLPWRRRDENPQDKNIVVVDATTGERIRNVLPTRIEREQGDVSFEPQTVPGDYWVYYLPYVGDPKAHYPKLSYSPPEQTAEPAWLTRAQAQSLPNAEFQRLEAVSPIHEFDDMETIATAQEVQALVGQAQADAFLATVENREHPVKMTRDLPQRWAGRDLAAGFEGSAERGEFYAFQVAVYAHKKDLSDLRVELGDLKGLHGIHEIPAAAFNCFNSGGVAHNGARLRKTVDVPSGRIQAMWCGVQVPKNAVPGRYETAVWVTAGDDTVSVPFALEVLPTIADGAGDDEPERLARLRWLDSTLASDDTVVPPFTPVERDGNVLSILGRKIVVGPDGLPESIQSFFTPEMTSIGATPTELLARPVSLHVDGAAFEGDPFLVVEEAEGAVTWSRRCRAASLSLQMTAKLEFDGTVEYRVAVRALEDVDLKDVRLEVALRKEVAALMMGLGFKGGKRPDSFEWAWDVAKNQDSLWVGAVDGGLQITLKDDTYRRPLNTNFYKQMPLNLPKSWHNEGKGTVKLRVEQNAVVVVCGGGARTMAKGEALRFDFRLAVTPFKPLDTPKHFATRYCHAFLPISEVKALGANTINVHHATPTNPFINYPFLRAAEMRAYVDEAHAAGAKVKIYYTVRELTARAPELWALLSLGNEVFTDGPGEGYSWLQEHVGEHYLAAWFDPTWEDSSLVTSGMSRWHNFYVEGLDWLARNLGVDGIYLDDVAFDREIMKRLRRVLSERRPDPLIDLHSANQYNPNDGFASSANLYMEHFPYIDRLWFGEYFDYGSAPDYWLTEVSGIPFGLMGEMLEGGGNPWRGIVFGMTCRLYGKDAPSPAPVWKLLDAFGMAGAEMIGWWSPNCPAKTGRDDVLATVYRKPGKALVAVASWAEGDVKVNLALDWAALGLNPAKAVLLARESEGFQPAAEFRPGDLIPVEPGKGLILEVSER